MKDNRTQRRRDKYFAVYRNIICAFAALTILLCFSLKLGSFFAVENLREITIGRQASFELYSGKESSRPLPENEGLHKDEISFVEGHDKDSKALDTDKSAPEEGYPILTLDMSAGASAGEVLINDTDSGAKVDIPSLLNAPLPSSLSSSAFSSVSTHEEPLVLVLHTHATECYSEEGVSCYDDSTSFRSTDKGKNMVAVGKVFSDTLRAHGIPTIHCETLHDEYDYNASYQNSLQSVKYYLEKYPSIKYVFDLHRDAIIKSNKELIKPYTEVNGKACAQVMTLVGTNALGADHPKWIDNMNLAIKLQSAITSELPGLARPINTRGASFNQQYAPGSLLFEIGSCGNTLREAKLAAVYLAENTARIIKQ